MANYQNLPAQLSDNCTDSAPITDFVMLVRKLESTSTLSDPERQAILKLPMSVRSFEAGHDIVRDGERPTTCALVIEGWVHRYKILPGGGRQILSLHVGGDVPDLQSLYLGTLDHGLAALTFCRIAFVTHDSLRHLVRAFPRLAELLWRETLIDAGICRAWIASLGRRTAYGRIAHLFCEMHLRQRAVGLADDDTCPMPLRYPDLADITGLTAVHISRMLKALRSDDLIALRSRTLVIRDHGRLYTAAEFDPAYLHLKSEKAAP